MFVCVCAGAGAEEGGGIDLVMAMITVWLLWCDVSLFYETSHQSEDEKNKNLIANKEPTDIESLGFLSDNKKGTIIKLGMNVDLSDEIKWKNQLQELTKLPSFVRVSGYEWI